MNIAAFDKKGEKDRPRVVVITNGEEEVTVGVGAQKGSQPYTFRVKVDAVPTELLKDTNGAGDSFAGGFLAKLC